jgi:hypothetical protein
MTGVAGEPGVSLLTPAMLMFASASKDVVDFGRRSSDGKMYSLNSCKLEGKRTLLAILLVNWRESDFVYLRNAVLTLIKYRLHNPSAVSVGKSCKN